jgi:hypothetical protein
VSLHIVTDTVTTLGGEVLEEQLRDAWQRQARNVPIQSVLHFTPEGLALGAGTVLVPADGNRRLQKLKGQEPRILALLSAAYGKAVSPTVLGNIERAAKCWHEGEDCLAYIHLAHMRLSEPSDPYGSARCLFTADALMKSGTSPRAILKALRFDAAYIDAVEKLYNPLELRVPKGSGRPSGRWTRGLSSLAELTKEAVESLGGFAARLLLRVGGAVTVFRILFVPSPNKIRIEGDVPGIPGLHYSWNRDETQLHLTYGASGGAQSTFTAELEDDVFRDKSGRVIGRVLIDGNIAIDLHAIPSIPANDDEPRLCPLPGLDKAGERGRDYEDYVKSIVNPVDTTPRYWGFQLPNLLEGGKLVYFDDCQHTTGMMVDAKGPEYARLISFPKGEESVEKQFLDQSLREVQAAGDRPIRWYFAEAAAAEFARELFEANNQGRGRIEIVVLPWSKTKQ